MRYQAAPVEEVGRARARRRRVSEPAIGWPPTKRWRRRRRATSARLVEPTSETTQSAPARPPARPRSARAARRRARSTKQAAGALERPPPSEPAARSSAPRRCGLGQHARGRRPSPTTSAPSSSERAAMPIEPPIRPTPRTAILIPRRGRARAAGQPVEHVDGGVPVHARVGDRLAVRERRRRRGPGGRRRGTTRASRRRSRALPPATCAATSAATAGWRSWSLPLLSCEASITRRSGRPAARSFASASATPVGAVVRARRGRRAG